MNRWEAYSYDRGNHTRYVINDVHPSPFGGPGITYKNWIVIRAKEERNPVDITVWIPGVQGWDKHELKWDSEFGWETKYFGRVIVDCYDIGPNRERVPLDVIWVQRPEKP